MKDKNKSLHSIDLRQNLQTVQMPSQSRVHCREQHIVNIFQAFVQLGQVLFTGKFFYHSLISHLDKPFFGKRHSDKMIPEDEGSGRLRSWSNTLPAIAVITVFILAHIIFGEIEDFHQIHQFAENRAKWTDL
jgi:hypothetical protein